MALYHLVFSLLVISIVQCIASTEVPVILWGDLNKVSIKANPLEKISAEEFNNLLSEELKSEPFTVIFSEQTLSVEDFSSKNSNGETSFPYLGAIIEESVYLPSVQNALKVLNELANPEKEDHVELTENGLSTDIEPEGGKFLFINLKDAQEGESRDLLLRRHNDFMQTMVTKLQKKYEKVVAVYTAHFPSWTISESYSRHRRQAENQNGHDYTFDHLKLYVKQIQLESKTGVVNLNQLTGNDTTLNNSSNILSSTLTFNDNSLTLTFINKGGYWFFVNVTLGTPSITEQLFPEQEIFAINGFAYRCADNITFTSFVNDTEKYTLYFEDLKIQPFFEESPNVVFGDSFNCVGFFSAPIWSGLFVVFILLSITFYGILMMMDIRTMDRFDDPKGKTITINAGE